MSKETGVIILGFLVGITPLLGFPESWRMAFFFIFGIALIILGFLMRSQIISRRAGNTQSGFARTFEQSEVLIEREE